MLIKNNSVSFDTLPEAVQTILEQVQAINQKIDNLPAAAQEPDDNRFVDINEIRQTIFPQWKRQTIYNKCGLGELPYGWQPPGEYVRITPVGGHRLNVFGLLSRDHDLHAYTMDKTVDSEAIIAFIDDFVKTITMKTVIVLDHASIHRSEEFNAKLGEWIGKGLRIFHLPPYSPHLNLIEILWRKMKYDRLHKNIDNVLACFSNTLSAALFCETQYIKIFEDFEALSNIVEGEKNLIFDFLSANGLSGKFNEFVILKTKSS